MKNKHSDALSKARIEKEEALGELEKRLKKEASEVRILRLTVKLEIYFAASTKGRREHDQSSE